MVGDPFQFKSNGTDDSGTLIDRQRGQGFNSLRETESYNFV